MRTTHQPNDPTAHGSPPDEPLLFIMIEPGRHGVAPPDRANMLMHELLSDAAGGHHTHHHDGCMTCGAHHDESLHGFDPTEATSFYAGAPDGYVDDTPMPWSMTPALADMPFAVHSLLWNQPPVADPLAISA